MDKSGIRILVPVYLPGDDRTSKKVGKRERERNKREGNSSTRVDSNHDKRPALSQSEIALFITESRERLKAAAARKNTTKNTSGMMF